jgi:hypothetical protein
MGTGVAGVVRMARMVVTLHALQGELMQVQRRTAGMEVVVTAEVIDAERS